VCEPGPGAVRPGLNFGSEMERERRDEGRDDQVRRQNAHPTRSEAEGRGGHKRIVTLAAR
jgi:hypothetical protein